MLAMGSPNAHFRRSTSFHGETASLSATALPLLGPGISAFDCVEP